jgi:hypothetical protein
MINKFSRLTEFKENKTSTTKKIDKEKFSRLTEFVNRDSDLFASVEQGAERGPYSTVKTVATIKYFQSNPRIQY